MIFLHILIGALTGVLSGFGLGGGTPLMLYLTTIGALEQTAAQGVNLLYFLPCSAAAIIGHIKNKQIDSRAAVFAIIAGLPCGAAGAFLAQCLDPAWLRRGFGVLLLLVGGRELILPRPGDTPKSQEPGSLK